MTDSIKTLAEDEIRVFCTEWLSRCGARFEETFEGSGDWTHLEVNVIRDMIEMYKAGFLAAEKKGEEQIEDLKKRVSETLFKCSNIIIDFESLKHTP